VRVRHADAGGAELVAVELPGEGVGQALGDDVIADRDGHRVPRHPARAEPQVVVELVHGGGLQPFHVLGRTQQVDAVRDRASRIRLMAEQVSKTVIGTTPMPEVDAASRPKRPALVVGADRRGRRIRRGVAGRLFGRP